MDERATEAEIQAKGLTSGPRITALDVDAVIQSEEYHVFPGTQMTVCCLRLTNGFTTIGSAACVSPANFNAELGQKLARAKARDAIWALEAYLLAQRVHDMEFASAALESSGRTAVGSGG